MRWKMQSSTLERYTSSRMRYIVQAIEARRDIVEGHILPQVPEALVHYDRDTYPMRAFIQTLRMAEGEPHVHMEDDIILTRNFQSKVEAAIAQHPDQVINFFRFKMREPFTSTKLMAASRYNNNPCVYFPSEVSSAAIELEERLRREESSGDRPLSIDLYSDLDGLIRKTLQARREKFVLWHPSLVQHRVGTSSISGRAQVRVSPTFVW